MKRKAQREQTTEVAVEPGGLEDTLLSMRKVLAAIGNPSPSTFEGLRRSGGFPAPVRLSPKGRLRFWWLSEVRAWMASRPRG